MADIKKFKLADGTVYNLKDANAVHCTNAELTDAMPVNADTLEGHPASYFAVAGETPGGIEIIDLSSCSVGSIISSENVTKLDNPRNVVKYNSFYYRLVKSYTDSSSNQIKLFTSLDSETSGSGVFITKTRGSANWVFGGSVTVALATYNSDGVLNIKISNDTNGLLLSNTASTVTLYQSDEQSASNINLELPSITGQIALVSQIPEVHAPTYAEVIAALGFTPMNANLKGANNGVAELGSDGKVPSAQLPSYVDDVLEYATRNNFPATGESGKIYIAIDTNITYRWSGTTYVAIGSSLALGETSSTAYRGDRGKTAYDHSQVTSGNPHNVTKSEVGLGNVENKSSEAIRSEITSSNVIAALGYAPLEEITSSDVTTALGYTPYNATNPNRYISGISGSDVTTALGYTPYNSTNPNGYITGITGQQVKDALGYTPYDNTNPNSYISGITGSDVTTALGYTPYNSSNPNNYIDATTTSLNNYYKKTEVDGMVANRFQALIVQALPTSGISTSTIYMVLQTGQTDIYDEWMYISNTWTKIGTTSIDMSEYAKIANLHNVATTGAYSSLVGKPTIPEDTAELTNSAGYVTKSVNNLDNYTLSSDLADVATTGSYADLSNTPAIPTALGSLTNDVGYLKQSDLATTNISSLYNDVPYATLTQIQGLQDIDVEEIKKAIAAMEHIGTVTQVTAGTGLTGGGNTSVTLNHSNSVTAKSGYPSGTTLVNGGSFTVRDAQYDAQGHITGTQDRVITMEEIPAYNDTAVRALIQDNTDDISALDLRVTARETMFRDTFNAFVFCIFGIEPYIDPTTMQIVPNRYYQRSDVDSGIFMDNEKIDIHLKTWLKYHYNIDDLSYLKNITCYVYAMGDHNEYVNHMVTFWSQKSNPSITSYPHLQQVGSFIDDGYGSVHRFTTTQVGAILSSSDDGYVAADPLGTGKGYVSGWNTLTGRVTDLETAIGDINSALDAINGEVI